MFLKKKTPPAYPQNISLDGREIPCRVTIHARAKRVWFKMKSDGILHITVPPGMAVRELMSIIKKNEAWIKTHHEEIQTCVKEKNDIEEGTLLPYLGESLLLRLEEGPLSRAIIEKKGQELHLKAGPDLTPADCNNALSHWYRNAARHILTQKTASFALLMNLTYKKLFIKDQKTRWGSCSSKLNLNFNYRLVMAPPEIIDYVVVHELSHLVHLNHSREFWEMVGKYYPNYKEARKWLKENGHSLKKF